MSPSPLGVRRRLLAGLALLLLSGAPAQAAASGGVKHVRSLLELRDAKLVRQHWDLSCGAAAVATLLTYQLGDPVSERQAALGMLRAGDPRLVRARLGFSLLDLKRFAASRGFEAAGYGGMGLDDLRAIAPAVVPLRGRGGGHFVVVRGFRGDRVLLGDPAFGNRTVTGDAFLRSWSSRVAFVVVPPGDPHPPNRIGAPAELFLSPPGAVVRAAMDAAGPGVGVP